MSNDTEPYVPMPMTCHPVFEGQVDAIRSGIESGTYALSWIEPCRIPPAAFSYGGEKPVLDSNIPVVTLDIKRCIGRAPFVGDPIWEDGWYEWRVAVDPLGRHVAGDASLSIVERVIPLKD